MKIQRVAAFTLMEVTIAMLISALVISMTYTIYIIVAHSFTAFNQKNNTIAMETRLDELLRKDFDHADRIEKTANGVALSNKNQTVTYTILPDAIVRTASITDTFKVTVLTSAITFENQTINSTTPAAEATRADDLEMAFATANDTLTGHYHKTYSSENLINRNAHALH